jgi:hypothetical protein
MLANSHDCLPGGFDKYDAHDLPTIVDVDQGAAEGAGQCSQKGQGGLDSFLPGCWGWSAISPAESSAGPNDIDPGRLAFESMNGFYAE